MVGAAVPKEGSRRSWDYLDRAKAAGAGAIVLTVDLGPAADATFRKTVQNQLTSIPGNFPDLTWAQMSASFAPGLTLDDIAEVVARTGLPVHVKGVLQVPDARRAIDAGAAGIVVSKHGRRQVAGVIPVAHALPAIVRDSASRPSSPSTAASGPAPTWCGRWRWARGWSASGARSCGASPPAAAPG